VNRIVGDPECPLCYSPADRDDAFFPEFTEGLGVDPAHSLFHQPAFHWSCYFAWPERETKKFVAVASGAARRANHHTETQIPVSERTAHPAPVDPPLPLEYVAMFRVMLVSALSSTALTTAMFDELGSGVRRRT
jgi:hypothetical protein